jgi:hypothetical protein
MTIKELADLTHTSIKVKDGRDGNILCQQYKSDKHSHLSDREILAVWAEIVVHNGPFDNFARPILCVYAAHKDGEQHGH